MMTMIPPPHTQDIDDGEQLDAAPLEALINEGEASEVCLMTT